MIHADPHYDPLLEVNLHAISANWRKARLAFSGEVLGAVVKSDAYGLGISRIAPWLEQLGCHQFWVSTLEEGVAVRGQARRADVQVFVLNGLGGSALKTFIEYDLIPVLVDRAEVWRARNEASCMGRVVPVAIHLDIGLTRVGLGAHDVAELAAVSDSFAGLAVKAWVGQLSQYETPRGMDCIGERARFLDWTESLPKAPLSMATTMPSS